MLENKIRLLRAEFQLSQAELAAQVGVRRETIGHLENNRYSPSLRLAWDIARVFDKSIEEVFSYTKDENL